MKLLATTILILGLLPALAQSVVLLENQPQNFAFESNYQLPDESIITTFSVRFEAATFTMGKSIQVDLFANTFSDAPFTFYIASLVDPELAGTGPTEAGVSWFNNENPLWPDLSGFARVTMSGGDAEIYGFSVYITTFRAD